MEVFGCGSTDRLCLSAPSGAMNARHAEPETNQLHPASLVNISKWQQIKGSFIHSADL